MACGHMSNVSSEFRNNCHDNSVLLTFFTKNVCEELVDMVYNGKRLEWTNDFASLKKIITESIGLKGKWSSPGGSSKKFTSLNAELSLTWYQGKKNTLVKTVKTANLFGIDVYSFVRQETVCQVRSHVTAKKMNERANPLR